MLSPARRHFSFREYLELEDASNTKHEFYAGEIYAMAGGTPEHAALSLSIGAALLAALRGGPCRVYSSDLRIRVMPTGLTCYPDVTVVCGPTETDPERPTTVTNPSVIVEVLSPSTEHYDREEKLAHYQQIPSLRTCILLASNRKAADVWERTAQGWKHTEYLAETGFEIDVLGITLDLHRVYADAGVA